MHKKIKTFVQRISGKEIMTLHQAEEGQHALLFIATLPLLMIMLVLVIDAGGAARALSKAQSATDAAAFAASTGVDIQRFYSHNELRLQPGVAAGLAGQTASLNSDGQLQIVGIHVVNDRVWVTGQMTYKSLFGKVLGFGSVNITVNSSSSPAFGIDERDQ